MSATSPESTVFVAIATPPFPSSMRQVPTTAAFAHDLAEKSDRRTSRRHHAIARSSTPAVRNRVPAITNAPCCDTSLIAR